MSVGVCVASREGIALSMDSRRMVRKGGRDGKFEIDTDAAQKLFPLDDRLAVATFGEATVGDQPVDVLINEFEGPIGGTVRAYGEAIGEFFSTALSEATRVQRKPLVLGDAMRRPLGFVVAGFDGEVGRAYEVGVRAGDSQIRDLPTTDEPGVHPFGLTDGIDRLLNGVDLTALKEARIAIAAEDEAKLDLLSYDPKHPEDVEGAVEVSRSLIEVQLLAQRISFGTYVQEEARVPGCGGEIRSLAVTRDGVTWAGAPSPEGQRSELRPPAAAALQPARRSA